MAEAVNYQDGIGRKELGKIRRRFMGVHRERLRRIEGELRPNQRLFINLLPLLFHINHPTLPGFVSTSTAAGIPDFTPSQNLLRMARKYSRSFEYKKRARRRYHIHGLYLMGSIGSIAHTIGSDFDVWLCHDPNLSARALTGLRGKIEKIENWARELALEVHIFLMNADAFRQGELSTLSHESSGSTQPRLLLEEFYRTGVLLAGRYPLWWLVPPEAEHDYSGYAAMLLRKRFVNALDCIDFGGLEKLPADEFFGAAHWQLFKGIAAPYKTILKLLLSEAYAQDYPHVRWLCQEAKRAIYDGRTEMTELDPYVLMYRRVEQYLRQRGETKRLELARRCFYFKAEQPLSRHSAERHERWQRTLLRQLTGEWGWEQRDLQLLDSRGCWKIDRVVEERNTLVHELTHSYRLLTDFARAYAHSGRIDPEELSLLGRKLYTALEKRPGKIDSINPGISKGLVEERVSLHYKKNSGGEHGWLLFLGDVNETQAPITGPLKTTNNLIEMLTWCHLNRVVDSTTLVSLYPEHCPVTLSELRSLLSVLRSIYPDGVSVDADMQHLSKPPCALACTLFINIGSDPMARLSRLGKQLTSDRSDPLSFGSAHHSLVATTEQLVTTSWGETLVFGYQGTHGLLDSLCNFLRMTLSAEGLPLVSAHSFSSVRAGGIARRVAQLFNDAGRCFSAQGGGPDSRYLLQADDEYYLIEQKQGGFSFLSLQTEQELVALLGQSQYHFRALTIDRQALQKTPYPAMFKHNREGIIQLFFHIEAATTQLYVLDENGGLFHQEIASVEAHHLLLQQQRFLNGLRLMRSLLAEEPAHRLLLDSSEFYRLTQDREGRFLTEPQIPPRHRMPDNYLDLRLITEGPNLNQTPHLLACGDREFSSLEHGEQLHTRVVQYILSRRTEHRTYPIYLTGIESTVMAGEGAVPTIELYQLKKRLEKKLNQALARLLEN